MVINWAGLRDVNANMEWVRTLKVRLHFQNAQNEYFRLLISFPMQRTVPNYQRSANLPGVGFNLITTCKK